MFIFKLDLCGLYFTKLPVDIFLIDRAQIVLRMTEHHYKALNLLNQVIKKKVLYNGYITDDWDLILCRTYLQECTWPDMLEKELQLVSRFFCNTYHGLGHVHVL